MQRDTSSRLAAHWIWDILGLNLMVRFAWLIFMRPKQVADFAWYFTHAKALAAGQGYHWLGQATAYWPIGWPFFLSLIYRITGPYVIVGLVVNVLLSTLIVALIYAISMQMFRRRFVALSAAIAYSVLPSQIEWNAILGSEELFTALLLISLYFYVKSDRDVGRTRTALLWIALSGIILGCAADVRPIPLAFPVFVLLYEWIIVKRRWMAGFWRAVVLTVTMFISVLPVTIRNFVALHHFVLVSTNGGVNLFQGTHTNGGYWWSWNPYVNPIVNVHDEIQKNKIAEHAAFIRIFHHIPTTIENGFLKIWDLYKADVNSTWYTFHELPHLKSWTASVDALNTTVYFLFMMVAAIGLGVLLIRRMAEWRQATFLLTFILYNTCFFFFFPAWDRFRYPMMPLFAVFVGLGFVTIWTEIRRSRSVSKRGQTQQLS